GDAAESLEVMYPYQRLQQEGYEVQIAAPSKKKLHFVVHDFEPGYDTYTGRGRTKEQLVEDWENKRFVRRPPANSNRGCASCYTISRKMCCAPTTVYNSSSRAVHS